MVVAEHVDLFQDERHNVEVRDVEFVDQHPRVIHSDRDWSRRTDDLHAGPALAGGREKSQRHEEKQGVTQIHEIVPRIKTRAAEDRKPDYFEREFRSGSLRCLWVLSALFSATRLVHLL